MLLSLSGDYEASVSPRAMIRGGCPFSGQGLRRNVEDVEEGLTHPSAPGQKIPRSDMKDEVLEQKMLRTINCVHLSHFWAE